MLKSDEIIARLRGAGIRFAAGDNIAEHLAPGDLALLEQELEAGFKTILRALVIDGGTDHNVLDTPKRVAKMYLREVFRGRYVTAPTITDFPNVRNLDEVYTLGPITVRSACSHHFVPITGRLWVGVLPGEKVIGISKFVRLADWVMSRPHIQEEAAIVLADELEKRIRPRGIALVMDATHQCMTWRGVKESSTVMTTSIMRGAFRDVPALRSEFMALIASTRQ